MEVGVVCRKGGSSQIRREGWVWRTPVNLGGTPASENIEIAVTTVRHGKEVVAQPTSNLMESGRECLPKRVLAATGYGEWSRLVKSDKMPVGMVPLKERR